MALSIAEAQSLWSPELVYLNTASFGLPPRPAWEALQAALADWRGGRANWEDWNDTTDRARATWARLVNVDASSVAVSSTVSGLIGLIAASIPDGTRVVAPDIEFGSALFPFLAQEHRGVSVRTVPLQRLTDAVDETTDVVVTSAVQMSNGAVVDLDAVEAAASAHGAMTVVDATHAVGWLPLDASRFDAVACAAYKWLMSPRGTAFMAVRPERLDGIVPHLAGWYAGEDPHDSYFGPPLRLATSARRLDVSPAWHSWVGTVPALEVVDADRRWHDPRPRRGARESLPRRSRARAGRLGHSLGRHPRRGGATRARRDHGRGSRWAAPYVLARLQHRGGRGRGARGAAPIDNPSRTLYNRPRRPEVRHSGGLPCTRCSSSSRSPSARMAWRTVRPS